MVGLINLLFTKMLKNEVLLTKVFELHMETKDNWFFERWRGDTLPWCLQSSGNFLELVFVGVSPTHCFFTLLFKIFTGFFFVWWQSNILLAVQLLLLHRKSFHITLMFQKIHKSFSILQQHFMHLFLFGYLKKSHSSFRQWLLVSGMTYFF